jgi:hypothetical protein
MSRTLVISGFDGCKFFNKAQQLAKDTPAAAIGPYEIRSFPNRDEYHEFRQKSLKALSLDVDAHKTSPMCFFEDASKSPVTFVGGFDSFEAYIQKQSA